MKAFKYLKRQHAEELINLGLLRLGTLYEYRDMEKHGASVGDPEEGKITKQRAGPVTIDETNMGDVFGEAGPKIVCKNGAKLHVEKYVNISQQTEDLYVFSASSQLCAGVMLQMGYDSCVKIDDMGKFAEKIDVLLHGQIKMSLGVRKCLYGDKIIPHDAQLLISPAFLKPQKYAYQQEVRAAWVPGCKVYPRIIEVSEVRDLCSILF